MKGTKSFKNVSGKAVVLGFCFLLSALGTAAQNPQFLEAAKKRLNKEFSDSQRRSIELADVCAIETDPLASRVFWEYGSIFVADNDVRLPDKCIYPSSSFVEAFQAKLERKKELIGTAEIELQVIAMEHLLKAINDAGQLRLTITPLHGQIAGGRSFADTVRLWNSRYYRALDHWARRGKITSEEAAAARILPLDLQIKKVVEWEANGVYFSTNFSKSIFYSVAPPGTSQHLSLLAFDVVEADDQRVRAIMNKHGWFQTIRTDKPHFTFLGRAETELPYHGLRNIYYEGNSYWVPSVEPVGTAGSVPLNLPAT